MDADTIYCTSCGAANKPGARFCFKCGKPIEAAGAPFTTSSQSDFITLSCPNCGGKLEIMPDTERFACKFCGSEHIVRRVDGAVSLAPVVEGLKQVAARFDQALTGSDRAAAEQTIQRLKGEIKDLEAQIEGKKVEVHQAAGQAGKVLLSILLYIIVIAFGLVAAFIFLGLIISLLSGERENFLYGIAGLGLVAITIFILGISGLKKIKRSPRRKERVEAKQAELAKLEASLQDRKDQLEQLHRYTVQR